MPAQPRQLSSSVKAASDVYAPIAGEIVEINQSVVDEPSLVNSDPMGKGWLFKMKIADRSQVEALMDDAGLSHPDRQGRVRITKAWTD